MRLSHDFEVKPEDKPEDESTNVDLTTAPDLHARNSTTPEKPKEPTYTDKPCKSFSFWIHLREGECIITVYFLLLVSSLSFLLSGRNIAEVITKETEGESETNLWSCRIPNLEVTGTGVYKKSYSSDVGVILLGKWRRASAPPLFPGTDPF